MDLCFTDATELARRLRAKELSASEVVAAFLGRIEEANPRLNAIVTLVPEEALRAAKTADADVAAGRDVGPLHGLPIAVKDLADTKGIRTTYGSPIYAGHVPEADDLLVTRLRDAGAIILGKTNTPEFGAGSQTFNPVFGATRNPWAPERTPGGSSGGAAAAVAAGLLPFADGSDMGGSVRNPASFCNLVGLRTTPGRVPQHPQLDAWQTLSVLGPIARTAADAALLLAAVAGPDPRVPLSLPEPGASFLAPLERDLRGLRVAWSPTLGGLPVAADVRAVLEAQRDVLAGLGCVVEEVELDLAEADEVFEVLRGAAFAGRFAGLLETDRERLKDTVVWNAEYGLALTGAQVARALTGRTVLFHRVAALLERFDVLAGPCTQVAPFPLEQEWVSEIDGTTMATYIEWMRSCTRISATAHPAISVPAGLTADGLPVGLQLVGRHGDDLGLLRVAHALDEATAYSRRHPPF